MASYTSPVRTRRSTSRSISEVAEGTPGKSPPSKRNGTEAERLGRRVITLKQRTAKAREGATKYLDGEFGVPGANFSLRKAADWVKAELEDEQEWSTQRIVYYIDKIKSERRESDSARPPPATDAGGSVADGAAGVGGDGAAEAARNKGGRPSEKQLQMRKDALEKAKLEAAELFVAARKKPAMERDSQPPIIITAVESS